MRDKKGAAPSHKILRREGGAEPVVVGDELADELVQPGLEDLVHAAVLQAGGGRARPAARPAPAGPRPGGGGGEEAQGLVAARGRARALLLEGSAGGGP